MEGRQGGSNTCREGKQDSGVQGEVGDIVLSEGGAGGGENVVKSSEYVCQTEVSGEGALISDIERLSLDVSEAQSSDKVDNPTTPALRKGLSVPDVGVEDMHDRVSFGSENSKSYKIGFLRHLGLKRSKTEGTSDPSSRKRMKSLRKTLSSLFHLRSKLDAEGAEGQEAKPRRPTSAPSIFRLPTRKNKNIPPCQRALPPVPRPGIDTPTTTTTIPPTSTPPDPATLSLSTLTLDTDQPTPQVNIRPDTEAENIDFAASIEKVKDVSISFNTDGNEEISVLQHGWYWGPLSGESAERILAGEPDGSFVVRDSSDHHYIFSLTFKLNGFVRHVRIEHDQGNRVLIQIKIIITSEFSFRQLQFWQFHKI